MHGRDSIFDFNYEADFIHQFDCGWFILPGSRVNDLWMVRMMFGRRSSFILQRSRWGAQVLLGRIHCRHHPINVRQRKCVNSSGVCPLLHNLESVRQLKPFSRLLLHTVQRQRVVPPSLLHSYLQQSEQLNLNSAAKQSTFVIVLSPQC